MNTENAMTEGIAESPPRKKAVEPMIAPMLAASSGSFRTLLARATSDEALGEPTRLLFVGVNSDCGNSTVAACAAITISRNSSRPVRLIEANLYRPALAGYLEVDARPGLVEIARGEARLETGAQASPFGGLSVITAGGPGRAPLGALGNRAVHDVIERASRDGAVTIIDGPALLDHADACSLGRHATEVVLVARAGKTTRRQIEAAVDVLAAARIDPIGVYLSRYHRDSVLGIPIGP